MEWGEQLDSIRPRCQHRLMDTLFLIDFRMDRFHAECFCVEGQGAVEIGDRNTDMVDSEDE